MRYEPVHHTIVALDVARSGGRDDQLLLRMRRDLTAVVRDALAEQAIDLAAVAGPDRGDGLRLDVPASVSASRLLDPFVPTLDTALREHRKASSPAARLRVRVAVHQGPVHLDDGVWAGAPMVLCARLLDAAPLRRVLDALPEANVALAVSESIHDGVVRHGYGLDPATYQRIRVAVKETDTAAWMHVPGFRPPYPVDGTDTAAPATHQNIATGSAHVDAQIGTVAGSVYFGSVAGSN